MLKYQLRRVTQFWGNKSKNNKTREGTSPTLNRDELGSAEGNSVDDDLGYSREEEYVYYMLAPPWARHRDPILYLQQF